MPLPHQLPDQNARHLPSAFAHTWGRGRGGGGRGKDAGGGVGGRLGGGGLGGGVAARLEGKGEGEAAGQESRPRFGLPARAGHAGALRHLLS